MRHLLQTSLALGLLLALAVPALAGPPAALAPGEARPEWVERSFQNFAQGWLRDLSHSEAVASSEGLHKRRHGEYKIELRPTGSPRAPWVGILRYAEELHKCDETNPKRCKLRSSRPVSEVFRFQNGRWVY